MVDSIERKIQFYQIEWVLSDNSREQKSNQFLENILSRKNYYSFTDSYDVVLERNNNTQLSDLVDLNRSLTSFWKISKIRKHDLPQKYSDRTKRSEPLNLAEDEGLYEPTHFFLINGSLLIAEYNHYGQQANSGMNYIVNEFIDETHPTDIKRVEIKQIMKGEAYNLLSNSTDIRSIMIKVATNYARILAQSDNPSLKSIFSAAELVENMDLILTFTLGRKKTRTENSFNRIISTLNELLSQPGAKENIKELKIKAKRHNYDERPDTINLIDDVFLVVSRVTKLDENSRAINSEEMFRNLILAYNENKNTLSNYFIQD